MRTNTSKKIAVLTAVGLLLISLNVWGRDRGKLHVPTSNFGNHEAIRPTGIFLAKQIPFDTDTDRRTHDIRKNSLASYVSDLGFDCICENGILSQFTLVKESAFSLAFDLDVAVVTSDGFSELRGHENVSKVFYFLSLVPILGARLLARF